MPGGCDITCLQVITIIVNRMTKNIVVNANDDQYGAKQENIFLALDENGEVLGSIYLYPFFAYDTEPEHPHNIYLSFRVDDGGVLRNSIKDLLLKKAMQRAAEIKRETGQTKTRAYACFLAHQKSEIAYFLSRGFIHDEGMYLLECNNIHELNCVEVPDGLSFRSWDMNTEAEQKKFIEMHRKIFPRHPYTIRNLCALMMRPGWQDYVCMDGITIAGNIMVYIQDENRKKGCIEDLFVQPQWRRRGVAKRLLTMALRHFQDMEIMSVQLEMWSANKAAMNLYQQLGFEKIRETEIALGRYV